MRAFAATEPFLKRRHSLPVSMMWQWRVSRSRRALVAKAKEDGLPLLAAEGFAYVPGKCIRATVDGVEVGIGSRSWLEKGLHRFAIFAGAGQCAGQARQDAGVPRAGQEARRLVRAGRPIGRMCGGRLSACIAWE